MSGRQEAAGSIPAGSTPIFEKETTLIFGGVFAVALFVLWIYCVFDVISTEESLMRNLPKMVWLVIVIFVPTVGSIAWLVLGRPQNAGFAPGDTTYRPEPRGGRVDRSTPRSSGVVAPDDDPRFLAQIDERTKRLQEWEEDLKRRDEELRRREEGEGPAAP